MLITEFGSDLDKSTPEFRSRQVYSRTTPSSVAILCLAGIFPIRNKPWCSEWTILKCSSKIYIYIYTNLLFRVVHHKCELWTVRKVLLNARWCNNMFLIRSKMIHIMFGGRIFQQTVGIIVGCKLCSSSLRLVPLLN
jgi:hypothetical protein